MAKSKKLVRKDFGGDLIAEFEYLKSRVGNLTSPANKICEVVTPDPTTIIRLLDPKGAGYSTYELTFLRDGSYAISKPYVDGWMAYKHSDLAEGIRDWILDYNNRLEDAWKMKSEWKVSLDKFIPDEFKWDVEVSNKRFELVIKLGHFSDLIPIDDENLEVTEELIKESIKKLRTRMDQYKESLRFENNFKDDLRTFLQKHKAHLEVSTWEEYTLYADVNGVKIDITEI